MIFYLFVSFRFVNPYNSDFPLKINMRSKSIDVWNQQFCLKNHKCSRFFDFFRSSKPIKSCYFLVKTDPTWWPLGRILKEESRYLLIPNFASIFSKIWSNRIQLCFEENREFSKISTILFFPISKQKSLSCDKKHTFYTKIVMHNFCNFTKKSLIFCR